MNDKAVAKDSGIYRVSMYVDEDVPYSSCSEPYELDLYELPITKYGYINKAKQSTNNCFGPNTNLLGHWYSISTTKTMMLTVKTDDSSTFETQVSFYKTCHTAGNVSIPSFCIKGETSLTCPNGSRGTSVSYKVKGRMLIFVGGRTDKDRGIYKVTFDLSETSESEIEEDFGQVTMINLNLLYIKLLMIY